MELINDSYEEGVQTRLPESYKNGYELPEWLKLKIRNANSQQLGGYSNSHKESVLFGLYNPRRNYTVGISSSINDLQFPFTNHGVTKATHIYSLDGEWSETFGRVMIELHPFKDIVHCNILASSVTGALRYTISKVDLSFLNEIGVLEKENFIPTLFTSSEFALRRLTNLFSKTNDCSWIKDPIQLITSVLSETLLRQRFIEPYQADILNQFSAEELSQDGYRWINQNSTRQDVIASTKHIVHGIDLIQTLIRLYSLNIKEVPYVKANAS